MKRAVLALAALAILFFGGRAIFRALASDETKIGWLVEDMIEGFNDSRTNQVLDGLDVNFLDEAYGTDRALVHQALAYLFLTAKEPATKKFLYHAEHTLGPVTVTESKDGAPQATTDVEIAFSKRNGEALEPAWKVRVHATLTKRDGSWHFFRTETSTLSGKQLR